MLTELLHSMGGVFSMLDLISILAIWAFCGLFTVSFRCAKRMSFPSLTQQLSKFQHGKCEVYPKALEKLLLDGQVIIVHDLQYRAGHDPSDVVVIAVF